MIPSEPMSNPSVEVASDRLIALALREALVQLISAVQEAQAASEEGETTPIDPKIIRAAFLAGAVAERVSGAPTIAEVEGARKLHPAFAHAGSWEEVPGTDGEQFERVLGWIEEGSPRARVQRHSTPVDLDQEDIGRAPTYTWTYEVQGQYGLRLGVGSALVSLESAQQSADTAWSHIQGLHDGWRRKTLAARVKLVDCALNVSAGAERAPGDVYVMNTALWSTLRDSVRALRAAETNAQTFSG